MPITLQGLRAAVADRSEAAARIAVQSLLAQNGYYHLPSQQAVRSVEYGTIRIYIWAKVKVGGSAQDDVVLQAGPQIISEINLASQVTTAQHAKGDYALAMSKTDLPEATQIKMQRAVGRAGGTPQQPLRPQARAARISGSTQPCAPCHDSSGPQATQFPLVDAIPTIPYVPAETTPMNEAVAVTGGHVYVEDADGGEAAASSHIPGRAKYPNEGRRLDRLNDLQWELRILLEKDKTATTQQAFDAMVAADDDLAPWLHLREKSIRKRITATIARAKGPKDGVVIWKPPAKRTKKGSTAVNQTMKEPASPGTWVDPGRCHVCGQRYFDFTAHCGSFSDAARMIREHNKESYKGGSAGGFKSRGSALWALRVCKLDSWYQKHFDCGVYWDQRKGRVSEAIVEIDDDGVHARVNDPCIREVDYIPPPSTFVIRGDVDEGVDGSMYVDYVNGSAFEVDAVVEASADQYDDEGKLIPF